MITQQKIDRINELARKSRVEPLSECEKEEQARLRAEYIAAFRQSLCENLEHTFIVDSHGNKTPIKPKTTKK